MPNRKSASYEAAISISTSMKLLFKNRNFLLVMHMFALLYSSLGAFDQELSLITGPFGFEAVLSSK